MNATSNPVNPVAAVNHHSHPWVPDQGDGTFCNPIIYADYSDPDVVRVGDDFYMVASSFNSSPGLPILHSRDLVNWTLVNHAVKNVPDPRYAEVQHGCGVWAPSIRFHAGKFWIFFPTPDEGIYVVTAENPAGTWSEPHLVQAGKGLIDPCPLWDDDGQAYLVHAYAGSRAGVKHRLRVCPMAPGGSRLLGEGKIVFHEPEKHPTLEGPKFLKKDGWYYILAPAGGVETGWQVVLRSKNIYGPYEDKIVLKQGSTPVNGPHQGALVDTADDGWWFIHFQDAGAYGRILHLQPVEWENGWPMMGRQGEPVLHHAKPRITPAQKPCVPQTSDEFDGGKLGLQWQWHANQRDAWYSLTARPGWLRLFSMPVPGNAKNIWPVPSLLLGKFPAPEFTACAKLDFSRLAIGEKAGLVVMGMDYAHLAVERTAQGFQLVKTVCKDAPNGGEEIIEAKIPLTSDSILLRVEICADAVCHFSYGLNGDNGFLELGKPFAARKGVWIGAKLGLFCLSEAAGKNSSHADFDWFRFAK